MERHKDDDDEDDKDEGTRWSDTCPAISFDPGRLLLTAASPAVPPSLLIVFPSDLCGSYEASEK